MCSLGILRLRSLCGQLLLTYKSNKCVLNQYITSQYRSVLKNSNLASKVSKTDLLNAKSNLEKDKLLFIYENPKFFYILNGFAFVQFFFWLQMSEFSHKHLKDLKGAVNKDALDKLPWWQNIDFEKKTTRRIVTYLCFFFGYSVLGISWLYTLKSVRMLVLHKGGSTVSIVTYGPFGINRTLTVPLDKVTTSQTRATAKVQLPIKVQGKWFYYILDTRSGKFPNPELFDFTAGMKRQLK